MNRFDFGRWLRQKREERGILGEDLAKKAGVTAVSISRYENSRRLPNVKVMTEICKALGIDCINLSEFEYFPMEAGESESQSCLEEVILE